MRKRVYRSDVEGVRDRKRERRHARRYARLHGYFWLPCLLCGTEYGGHEAGGTIPSADDSEVHTGMCPWCTAERQEAAERRLRQLGEHGTTQTTRWGFKDVVAHRVGAEPSTETRDSFVINVTS